MKMHMIAGIYSGDNRVGFRILDADENKIIDVKDSQVINVLSRGIQIRNLKLVNGKIQGSNGDINRYAKVVDGLISKTSPLVVINTIGNTYYTVSDHKGQIIKMRQEDIIRYALENGIANGKVSERDGKKFISAICGSYEHIEPVAEQTEEKPDDKVIKSEEHEIDLNDLQLSALHNYYIDRPQDYLKNLEEVSLLYNAIKDNNEKSYMDLSSEIYKVIAKLNTDKNIRAAFGDKLGGHVIEILNAKLPLPISLVDECAEYAFKRQQEFYTIVTGLNDAVRFIYSTKLNDGTVAPFKAMTSLLLESKFVSRRPNYKSLNLGVDTCNFESVYTTILLINLIKDVYVSLQKNIPDEVKKYKGMLLKFCEDYILQLREKDESNTEVYIALAEVLGMFLEFQEGQNFNSYSILVFENTKRYKVPTSLGDIYSRQLQLKSAGVTNVINQLSNYILDTVVKKNDIIDLSDKDDRCSYYKELRERINKLDEPNYSIVIADDMMKRKLEYSRMSSKQKFRLNEAIKYLEQQLGVNSKISGEKDSKNVEDAANNTYKLEDRKDIEDKINALLEKADSVEMSSILEVENFVLKICYSVIKYKKVSDKQIKHIENAYNMLINQ